MTYEFDENNQKSFTNEDSTGKLENLNFGEPDNYIRGPFRTALNSLEAAYTNFQRGEVECYFNLQNAINSLDMIFRI